MLQINLEDDYELDLLIDGLGFVMADCLDAENNWNKTEDAQRAERAAKLRIQLKVVKNARALTKG